MYLKIKFLIYDGVFEEKANIPEFKIKKDNYKIIDIICEAGLNFGCITTVDMN